MLVDTHCHLGDARFDMDRAAVIDRARAAGVEHVVIVADTADASDRAIELARTLGLSATAGVHPHEAVTWSAEIERRINHALDDPTVVAVGETGLDYYYEHSPRDVQRRVFEHQLALGIDRGLPVVVHARDADEDLQAILAGLGRDAPRIVLHSFSSGPSVLDAARAIGAYISFSGMVTFANWTRHDAVRACPDDRLLIETDAPYLSPVPHRGSRNEPAHVRHVAARVAELKGVTAAAIESRTAANAAACFGPRVAQPIDHTP